jgi:hypothetical protein
MNATLGRPAPGILVLLWRNTAEAWGKIGRRNEALAQEHEGHGFHESEALLFRQNAALAFDHQKRALENADKLERGEVL